MVGLIYSCQKEQSSVQTSIPSPPLNASHQATEREEVEVSITKNWLQVFQNDLKSAVLSTATTSGVTYSPDEIVAGVEALLNLSSASQPNTGQDIKVANISVDYSSTSNALKEIYEKSLGAYNAHLSTFPMESSSPIGIDVLITKQDGNLLSIKVTTFVGFNDLSELKIGDPCGKNGECPMPFSVNEAYRVGAGDQELILQQYYWLLPCEGACGTIANCQIPPSGSTAYEKIESKLNSRYSLCKNPCKPLNVSFYSIDSKEIDASQFTSIFDDNLCTKNAFRIGDCMNSEELNCKFCAIYNKIGQTPLDFPATYAFVSINLGLDNIPCCGGTNACQFPSFLKGEMFFGKYICYGKAPGDVVDGLTIDLNDLEF
jgi:hypothetical protein